MANKVQCIGHVEHLRRTSCCWWLCRLIVDCSCCGWWWLLHVSQERHVVTCLWRYSTPILVVQTPYWVPMWPRPTRSLVLGSVACGHIGTQVLFFLGWHEVIEGEKKGWVGMTVIRPNENGVNPTMWTSAWLCLKRRKHMRHAWCVN